MPHVDTPCASSIPNFIPTIRILDKKSKASCHVNVTVHQTYINFKARNEINDRRLKWLEEYSKILPIPELFGETISLNTIDLFINATLETRHRGLFFIKKILPELRKKQSFLDIGPGKGKLTTWIGRKFKEVMIVDTCEAALDAIKAQKFGKEISIIKIQKEFIKHKFAQQKFDLINMSHVIYYLDQKQLIHNIKKAYDLLTPHGILVVVFNEGLHREKIARDFGGKPQSFDVFFRLFSFLYNVPVDIYISRESFCTKELLPMLHICGLHLCDQGVKVDRQALEFYIKKHYLNNNGMYCMDMYQKFAIIRKGESKVL